MGIEQWIARQERQQEQEEQKKQPSVTPLSEPTAETRPSPPGGNKKGIPILDTVEQKPEELERKEEGTTMLPPPAPSIYGIGQPLEGEKPDQGYSTTVPMHTQHIIEQNISHEEPRDTGVVSKKEFLDILQTEQEQQIERKELLQSTGQEFISFDPTKVVDIGGKDVAGGDVLYTVQDFEPEYLYGHDTGEYGKKTLSAHEYDIYLENLGKYYVSASEDVDVSQIPGIMGDITRYPKGTKFRKTEEGYEILLPETVLLQRTEKELGEINKLPPVLRDVAKTGYYFTQSMFALTKPVSELVGIGKYHDVYTNIATSAALNPVSGKEMTLSVLEGEKAGVYGIHHVSLMDYVFEPIGWSPKGSTEILMRDPIHSTIGGGLGEIAQGIAFSKLFGAGMKAGGYITRGSVKKIVALSERFHMLSKVTKPIAETTFGENIYQYSMKGYVPIRKTPLVLKKTSEVLLGGDFADTQVVERTFVGKPHLLFHRGVREFVDPATIGKHVDDVFDIRFPRVEDSGQFIYGKTYETKTGLFGKKVVVREQVVSSYWDEALSGELRSPVFDVVEEPGRMLGGGIELGDLVDYGKETIDYLPSKMTTKQVDINKLYTGFRRKTPSTFIDELTPGDYTTAYKSYVGRYKVFPEDEMITKQMVFERTKMIDDVPVRTEMTFQVKTRYNPLEDIGEVFERKETQRVGVIAGSRASKYGRYVEDVEVTSFDVSDVLTGSQKYVSTGEHGPSILMSDEMIRAEANLREAWAKSWRLKQSIRHPFTRTFKSSDEAMASLIRSQRPVADPLELVISKKGSSEGLTFGGRKEFMRTYGLGYGAVEAPVVNIDKYIGLGSIAGMKLGEIDITDRGSITGELLDINRDIVSIGKHGVDIRQREIDFQELGVLEDTERVFDVISKQETKTKTAQLTDTMLLMKQELDVIPVPVMPMTEFTTRVRTPLLFPLGDSRKKHGQQDYMSILDIPGGFRFREFDVRLII